MNKTMLTDKEKIDTWIELIEFNNFLVDKDGMPLPGEFKSAILNSLQSDEIEFTESGSTVCTSTGINSKIIIPDKVAAKGFIDTANTNFLLFIYVDLITKVVTGMNVEIMYIVWVKLMNRFSEEFDYDIPHHLLPNFIKNDTFNMLEKVIKEV